MDPVLAFLGHRSPTLGHLPPILEEFNDSLSPEDHLTALVLEGNEAGLCALAESTPNKELFLNTPLPLLGLETLPFALADRNFSSALLAWVKDSPTISPDRKGNTPLHHAWDFDGFLENPTALALAKYMNPRIFNKENLTPFGRFCSKYLREKVPFIQEALDTYLRRTPDEPAIDPSQINKRFWGRLLVKYNISQEQTSSYNLLELVFLLGDPKLDFYLLQALDIKTFHSLAARLSKRYLFESVKEFEKDFYRCENKPSFYSLRFFSLQKAGEDELLQTPLPYMSLLAPLRDRQEVPLLCTMARKGLLKPVATWIQKGANPSVLCHTGNSILHFAFCNTSSLKEPSLLTVMNYVDPRIQNEDGMTAFQVACRCNTSYKNKNLSFEFSSWIRKTLTEESQQLIPLPKEFWDVLDHYYIDKSLLHSCNIVEFVYLFGDPKLDAILFNSIDPAIFHSSLQRLLDRYPQDSVSSFASKYPASRATPPEFSTTPFFPKATPVAGRETTPIAQRQDLDPKPILSPKPSSSLLPTIVEKLGNLSLHGDT